MDVEVTDGRLSLMATSSGGRLLYCQAIKYLKITRIADALTGPWAPIAGNTKGAWWQMELGDLTPVGLVSVTPATGGFSRETDYTIPIKDEVVRGLDCRNWWLYKGRSCADTGMAGHQQNPLGRFKNGGTETGVVISVSNTSCAGEVCDAAGQHMCGSDEGTPGKTSFDRAAFSRVMSNGMFPQFSWCDGVVGKYVRVWLPGKDRLFDANVLINRKSPVSPNSKKASSSGSGNPCAVKTVHFSPEGAKAGSDYAGKKTLTNNNCNALKNLNDDGSCCEPTSSTVSNAETRSVVCCADKNPFTPTCASGKEVNLATGSLAMFTGKRQASAWSTPANLRNDVISDTSKQLTGAEAAAKVTRFWCDPECSVVIDLGQAYDISIVEFVARGMWDSTTNAWQVNNFIAKHDIYALALDTVSVDLAAVPSSTTIESLMLKNEDYTQSWVRIAGHTGNTHGMVHTLSSPVRTRYLKLYVSDNAGKSNRYVSLQTLSIVGCDPDSSKTLVPHLKGTPDPGYLYGGSNTKLTDPVNYPFAKYGWWEPSFAPGRNVNRDQCTTSWGMTSLEGCATFAYSEAKDMCANVGGRMCTVDEVANGCTTHTNFGTRCNKNDAWTSSTCDKETTGVCAQSKNGADSSSSSSKDDDTVVCYGVEAQVHEDSSTPEYIIADDPEDPIFYSTCYVRERSVGFKPIGGKRLVKGDFAGDANETTVYNSNVDTAGKSWKVNGACLSCKSYANNLGTTADDSHAPPRWIINNDNDCRSCEAKADLLLSKCNATAGIDKAIVKPCFVSSAIVCPASVAVADSMACANAIKVATLTDVSVTNVDSAAYPTGCSFRQDKGALSAYFNTLSGNKASCLTGIGSSATDNALSGEYATTIETSIAAKIVSKDASVVLTLRGPTKGWFAFGFAAKRMGDFPHTLVVESAMDNVKVSEWRLGSHARGKQLGVEAFVELGKGSQYWREAGCTNSTGTGLSGWASGDKAIGHVQCCSDADANTCNREKQGAGTSTQEGKCSAGYDYDKPPCAHDGVNAYMKKTKDEQCDGPGEFELTVEQCANAAAWITSGVRKNLISPISSKNPLGGREYGETISQGCVHLVSKSTATGDRSVRCVPPVGYMRCSELWPSGIIPPRFLALGTWPCCYQRCN